jgi:hypothetical protein
MATSPLFGWQEPDDTSLVKDGAAAIRTLGNAIDSSMGDLLGGTTGQVLAKASNTNMDFTWVAQDDSNAIQNAIVDAKGDLIAATANDTPARLAVGNNGETLVADSSQATGLRYTAGTVAANPVINAAMQVWQRGTSVAGSGSAFAADRWQAYRSVAGSTCSRQVTNDTTNLPFIQYATRVQRDSGNTSTAGNTLLQCFESMNSIPYAGKTVTLSFYARAGANYSPTSSGLEYNLATGTGTDQNLFTGFTGRANPILGTATLTTTWQRFSATATLASSATQIALAFSATWVGTAGANDWFEITGVQLDVGSVALPFRTYAATIQGELAACQRYYYRSSGTGSDQTVFTTFGYTYTTTNAVINFPMPVTMRVKPTAIDYANLLHIQTNGGQSNLSALTINNGGTNVVQLIGVSGAITNSLSTAVAGNASGTPFIGLSAEL